MNYKKFLRTGNEKSDITPLLNNDEAFNHLINDIITQFNDIKIDKVACIEGRGFLIGAPVAFGLKVGLLPIRSKGKLKNEVYSETYIDYSGKEKILEIHKDAVLTGERILLVDDWVETGATNKAAIKLIEKCGGKVAGIGAFMDDSKDELKDELKKYNYHYIERVEEEDRF